jgi:hypothetical protein
MFEPSYFIAAIRTGHGHALDREYERVFRRVRGSGRQLSVVTDAFSCHFLLSAATTVAVGSPGGDVTLVFHGELYPDLKATPAARCLEAYLKEGMRFVAGLHGSFALVVVDKRVGRLAFATDPINSRKLFCGDYGGYTWISTALAFHLHPSSGDLDIAGLAHYLVNGTPLYNRTLIGGIRVLERAAVHEYGDRGLTSEPYWHFEFDPRLEASEETLREELQQALREAVLRRLPTNERVYLSLSAGYDSTSILGLLKSLGAREVSCFSYTKLGGVEDGDAHFSRATALGQGYPHLIVPGYQADLTTVIQDNISCGRGLTRLVAETDAWQTVGEAMAAEEQATVWVGDAIGMRSMLDLGSAADVLWSLGFGDWDSLDGIGQLMPEATTRLFEEALHGDLSSMLDRNSKIEDLCFLRYSLYLDYGLPRLLSWRETFAGSYAEVRNPLLDTGILEQFQTTPSSLLLGRKLYRDTVEAMFPDLFARERASGGGWVVGRWAKQQLGGGPAALRPLLDSSPSPLDEYVPPSVLLRLAARQASPHVRWRKLSRKVAGRLRRRASMTRRQSDQLVRPRKMRVATPTFLLRALFLREFLRQRFQD